MEACMKEFIFLISFERSSDENKINELAPPQQMCNETSIVLNYTVIDIDNEHVTHIEDERQILQEGDWECFNILD